MVPQLGSQRRHAGWRCASDGQLGASGAPAVLCCAHISSCRRLPRVLRGGAAQTAARASQPSGLLLRTAVLAAIECEPDSAGRHAREPYAERQPGPAVHSCASQRALSA